MSSAETEIIIEAGHTERNYWRDLFPVASSFIFWDGATCLLKNSDRNTFAVRRPFFTILVFVSIFGRMTKLPTERFRYPLKAGARLSPTPI